MNYNSIIKSFISEAKAGTQYKKMSKPFSIFAFIAMLPMMLISAVSVVSYYVLLFVYNGLASSVQYLERWLDGKKSDVRHATEAVLYFVAMPYIFFCQALLAIFAVVFYFTWFGLMVFTYLSTLGGVRWQPFLNTASFDGKTKITATTNEVAANVYALISFILFAFVALFFLISVFGGDVGGVYMAFSSIYWSHVIIANLAIFRKKTSGCCDTETAVESVSVKEDASVVEIEDNTDEYDSLPEL